MPIAGAGAGAAVGGPYSSAAGRFHDPKQHAQERTSLAVACGPQPLQLQHVTVRQGDFGGAAGFVVHAFIFAPGSLSTPHNKVARR